MARVLVIDDDAGTLYGYKGILRAAGHEVVTVALGEDGVAAMEREQFEVVLCDQRLPDRSGVDVVRLIREISSRTAIVLMTAWGTPALVIEAKRNGVTLYADKPLIGDELLIVVEEARRLQTSRQLSAQPPPFGHAAWRWADLVARGAYFVDDLKNVSTWCRGVGLGRSTLKAWCKAAGIKPKASVDFIRLLQLVIHHAGEPWSLQHRLDTIDERTAEALIRRAGLSRDLLIPDIDSFMSQQRLIIPTELVAALNERLKRSKDR